MSYSFGALSGEYTNLLASMMIAPEREDELDARAKVILARAANEDYAAVAVATGVPKLWAVASFEREAGSDYRLSPAQGDPWDEVSRNVPRGRGPFASWAAAAIDAYRLDGLDRVGAANWTWPRACYYGELFNGFGYRSHGVNTPYLWSWSNNYRRGKYIADGEWSPSTVDEQCGMIPLMVALLKRDPTLSLVDSYPKSEREELSA
jgi:lysozyme family protein